VNGRYGVGTAMRLPGTICAWYENTSRLRGSTVTFTHMTSLLWVTSLALSPNVSTRVKFSRRRPSASRNGECRQQRATPDAFNSRRREGHEAR